MSTPLKIKRLDELASSSLSVSCLVGVIFILELPPGLFGQNYAAVHLGLCIILFTLLSIFHREKLKYFPILQVLCFLLYFFYLFTAQLLINPSGAEITAKICMASIVGTLCCGVLAAIYTSTEILRSFIYLTTFICASYVLYWIFLILGLDIFQKTFLVKFYEDRGLCTYIPPISFFYSQEYLMSGHRLLRAMGIFREPGIFQCIVVSAIYGAYYLREKRLFLIISILAIGLMSTLSTAAFASIIASLLYLAITRFTTKNLSKYLLAIPIILCAVGLTVLSNDIEEFGFSPKLSGESGRDRIDSMYNSFNTFSQFPLFGIGLTSDDQWRYGLHGLHFLAGLALIGILGATLFFFCHFICIRQNYSVKSFGIYIPILVTWMTSQPLYYTTIPVFFLLLSFKKAEHFNHVIET